MAAIFTSATSCVRVAFETATSSQWGDAATWAGAVGSLLVAFVAVLPLEIARRQRKARGRLVAAHLVAPFSLAHQLMKRNKKNMDTFAQYVPSNDYETINKAVCSLEWLVKRMPGFLEMFKVTDGAYLPKGVSSDLAQAIGLTNTTLLVLQDSLDKWAQTSRASGMQHEVDARRAKVIEKVNAHLLPEMFDRATERLGQFAAYCEKLFPTA